MSQQQRSATATALTIAGSDPSGGAGIQADMKAMSALGAYATSVITALTAQSTRGVAGVHAVPVDFVRLQLDTLLDDIVPDATKIGMLATAELADAVGEYLPGLSRTVLDPVMVATSGDRLLDKKAVGAVRRLCAKADLITPNLHEAAVLLSEEPAATLGELRTQARRLLDLGARRVLVKGGHLTGDADESGSTSEAIDVYADAGAVEILHGRRSLRATPMARAARCPQRSPRCDRAGRPGWRRCGTPRTTSPGPSSTPTPGHRARTRASAPFLPSLD